MQCDSNKQSENMSYNKVLTVIRMYQTDSSKPCYQIFLFIVELHTNTAEVLLSFLLYISAQLNK